MSMSIGAKRLLGMIDDKQNLQQRNKRSTVPRKKEERAGEHEEEQKVVQREWSSCEKIADR